MTFISSQRAHFVTFLCSHRIEKLLLQKVFVFLSNRKMCQKRIKNDIHFVTFLSHHQIKNFFYIKFLYFHLLEICVKRGLKTTFISSQVFISSLFNVIIKSKTPFTKSLYILANRRIRFKKIKNDIHFVTKGSFSYFSF